MYKQARGNQTSTKAPREPGKRPAVPARRPGKDRHRLSSPSPTSSSLIATEFPPSSVGEFIECEVSASLMPSLIQPFSSGLLKLQNPLGIFPIQRSSGLLSPLGCRSGPKHHAMPSLPSRRNVTISFLENTVLSVLQIDGSGRLPHHASTPMACRGFASPGGATCGSNAMRIAPLMVTHTHTHTPLSFCWVFELEAFRGKGGRKQVGTFLNGANQLSSFRLVDPSARTMYRD